MDNAEKNHQNKCQFLEGNLWKMTILKSENLKKEHYENDDSGKECNF